MATDLRIVKIQELGLSVYDACWLRDELTFQMTMLVQRNDGPNYDLDYILRVITNKHPKSAELRDFISFCNEKFPHYGSIVNTRDSIAIQIP